MTYITRERREEIRKRIEAATEGPWHGVADIVRDDHDHDLCMMEEKWNWEPGCGRRSGESRCNDAAFIAHSRTDVPDLLEAYEDVIKLAEQMREKFGLILERLGHYCGRDGSEPYEGEDCPHEFIGLAVIEAAEKLLSNPLLSEIKSEVSQ